MFAAKKYDRACKGCIYLGSAGDLCSCDYIFKVGKRRPCPPGKGCTVKETKKRGRPKKGGTEYAK